MIFSQYDTVMLLMISFFFLCIAFYCIVIIVVYFAIYGFSIYIYFIIVYFVLLIFFAICRVVFLLSFLLCCCFMLYTVRFQRNLCYTLSRKPMFGKGANGTWILCNSNGMSQINGKAILSS